MLDVLTIVGVFAVCGLMVWTATRIEPHWASRDGQRFACASRRLNVSGEQYGRWRQVRIGVEEGRALDVQGGTMLARARTRHSPTDWVLESRDPAPPKRKAMYVLKGDGGEGRMVIRVPAKSRCVPVLDERLGLPPLAETAGSAAAADSG